MVSPVLIQLSKKEKGLASGNIFAVGTIGSFFGAIITGFVLIPNVPISYMLVTVPVFSILIGGYWLLKQKSIIPVSITVTPYAIIALISLVMVVPSAEAVIFETESLYGNIKVVEKPYSTSLFFDGALQSMVSGSGDSIIAFVQYSVIPIFYNPDAQDVLVVGLGAGSISHEYYHKLGIETQAVEIDPEILKVATNYFHVHGDVIIDDARHYIKTTNDKYDVIIYDAFLGDSFPTHLFSREAFTEAKQILNKDGIILLNQAGKLNSERLQAYYTTLSSVFTDVDVISFSDADQESNMQLFLASDTELTVNPQTIKQYYPLTEGEIYQNVLEYNKLESLDEGILVTDDFNTLDILQYEVVDEWREYYWSMEN